MYENKLEASIEGHDIQIQEITKDWAENKEYLIEKTKKLQTDVDLINTRMEGVENISNGFKDSFDVLIDSIGIVL